MSDPITPTPAGASDPTAVPVPAESNQVAQAPVGESQDTEAKRLVNALDKVEKTNDELRKVVDLQASLVSEDPALLDKIHGSNPVMANRIVEKLYGQDGIKTFNQLQERNRLEALRSQDPNAYESKKELQELRAKMEERDRKDRDGILSSFLSKHGIQATEYDQRYKSLTEALGSLNPSLVQEDLPKALNLASQIAFKTSAPAPQGVMPQGMNFTGTPTDMFPAPPKDQNAVFLAEAFKGQGFKMAGY